MKKRKVYKIGIVVDQLLAGGVQLSAIEQVKELNNRGHDAKLLILMRKKYSKDFSYLIKGVPHLFLSDSYPKILQKTYKFPIFSFLSTLHLLSPILAPKVIKKNEYDILISLGTTTCLTTQAIFRIKKIPYIAVIHDPIVYILKKAYSRTILNYLFPVLFPIAKFLENSFVKDAKKTVIISKVHFSYLKKNYKVRPEIMTFGTTTLRSLPKKRGSLLLSFGRWQNGKNPFFLLKLLKEIPETKIIIAGTWTKANELNNFKKIITNERLEKRVEIVEEFNSQELERLCSEARLFLHPHFEAFGLAALEAAGQGLPIIIPKNSGVTEIFEHGADGYFPKRVELKEYKKYVKNLLQDEKLAYSMGKHAWETTRKKVSWRANVAHLLDLISQSLGEERKTKIIVIETGHALNVALAGGDSLMEPMALRLKDSFDFSIISSSVGYRHWEKAKINKDLFVLKKTFFDDKSQSALLFLAYCLRMWQTFLTLRKKIRLPGKMILYSSTNILPDILPAYFIRKTSSDIPWVARIHHLIPPPFKRKGNFLVNTVSFVMQELSLKMIKDSSDLIIALNEKLRSDLEKRGFPRTKVHVLGGGIEMDKIRKIRPGKEKFNGVLLGRLHVTKGVFDSIAIWKLVVAEFPKARLAIIGGGPKEIRTSLVRKIKEEGLTSNVFLLGYVPERRLYEIMKNADLFLFLDHEAGWGLAVAEAMACKLPVIGYNNGVLGVVFKKGYLLSPIGGFKKTAKNVIYIMRNTARKKRMGKAAYFEAQKNDWGIASSRLKHLLESPHLD